MISDIGGLEIDLYRANPVAWFERYGNIVPKDLTDYDVNQRPRPNVMQLKLGEIISWCGRNYKPVDVIISKPRQEGCSTITVAALYVFVRSRPNVRTLILGGEDSQCENLWVILQHYAETDQCNWGNTFTTGDKVCKCSNGSIIRRRTAGNPKSGRGGTWHAIIITELAHWPTDGAKNAAKSLTSALGGVPKNIPGVMLITESTAFGPEGRFPNQFHGAVEFEDLQKGKTGNGTVRMFFPWFSFEKARVKLTAEERAGLREKLTKARDTKAILVWDRHHLDAEQIAHYHQLLNLQEIGGDPIARDREYPSTPEDGFQASNPSRFSRDGLDWLETMAIAANSGPPEARKLRYGKLVLDPGASVPRLLLLSPDDPEADTILFEDPVPGGRYIVTIDNCKGEETTTGDDIDKNSVLCVRDGYYDSSMIWHPPCVVISMTPGNEWEYYHVAEYAAKMSKLYGGCITAPETNRGEGVIRELKLRGCLMIERPRSSIEVDVKDTNPKYGWLTSASSKPAMIGELARRVQEPNAVGAGIAVHFPHIVKELRTFVRLGGGKEGAMKVANAHDDTVITLAIGISCLASATSYWPKNQDIHFGRSSSRTKAGAW